MATDEENTLLFKWTTSYKILNVFPYWMQKPEAQSYKMFTLAIICCVLKDTKLNYT